MKLKQSQESMCRKLPHYSLRTSALREAEKLAVEQNRELLVYECGTCGDYHVAGQDLRAKEPSH